MLQYRWLWPTMMMLLILSSILSVSVGPVSISLMDSLSAVFNWATQQSIGNIAPHEQLVVSNVRLPRTLLALTVGAILAQCGAVMQGLFRNPLADPGIIGVSSGAALGAAICIVLFPDVGSLMISLGAFLCGLATTLIVYRLASNGLGTSVVLLLLSGVAIAALAGAGIGVLTYLANDMALRDLTLWQMGSIAGAQWQYVGLCLLVLVLLSWRFQRDAMALNALLLGEAEARHLGINVDRLKLRLILLCALGVGVSVAATGIIGFIGLVVPHLVRMILGPDHKRLLPMSALLGAALLALADIGARTFLPPAELPVSLVTALIGAPFFIFLLLQQRSKLI
ncbi:iron ABC transporter permease [Shewanella oneidensis MR-1]|uniref:ABC-type hemin uptake system permease component HmuC n=1 Tax=Shewanella oneidensis (strain ATCC 700550 / JCM 31522 / CIP 106686 / LMG 19005 / NCIMB 14063 / MR-1) TaxID=211586 RepID=Q8EB60_SHEON|nr:iron ABC transporter permease [Shewanella oneidensis]AAN56659.1 ABC-type hemin uptake system permease component HmuC [Shewanella oneidensis MR-1]MDX5998956.1 iron ABC transporter permease [Shewanella oneidensis]MEE2027516.1 Hemin transport system permease protein HmuU [Shewanella oneidensis]QKG98013.1 iron ABC transporter permease [Shewanella oneidensis MR-1]